MTRLTTRMAKGTLIYKLVFGLLLVAFVLPLVLVDSQISISEARAFTFAMFLVIGMIGLVGLHKSSAIRPFSLDCAHWIFVLFFFYLAPVVQFLCKPPF